MRRPMIVLIGLGVVFLGLQLVPVERNNPPGREVPDAPPEVLEVLRASCFDCHSNQTRWPWYAYVAPVSWLITHDVEEGRHELNFSAWSEYGDRRRARIIEECAEEVREGKMPPRAYRLLHRGDVPDADDLAVLEAWAESAGHDEGRVERADDH